MKYTQKKYFLFIVLLLSLPISSQVVTYPTDVNNVLIKAGYNQKELKKVLDHYAKSPIDSLKYRAACFLIASMPSHLSRTFYWADSLNKKVPFDEFSFPNFKTAVTSFNKLSMNNKLHPVVVSEDNLLTMNATYLIDNIEMAFNLKNKPWAYHLSFGQFCEYLLPYNFMDEKYTEWRTTFQKEYSTMAASHLHKTVRQFCASMCDSLKGRFFNTYVTNGLTSEPAFLSPNQMLFRKQGACEDMANWGGYVYRSFGIATTVDYTPAWATSTGAHYWNVCFGEHGEPIPFVMGSADSPNRYYLHREPSKVLRITYSIQNETLSQKIPVDEIPEGHLRSSNYLDVTKDYWKVFDLTVMPDSIQVGNGIYYVAVLNGLTWRPVWWGQLNGGKVIFTNLSCGVVYLPLSYMNGNLTPVASPYLLRSNNSIQVLNSDASKLRRIMLAQEENYLIFQPGKKYTLYYWQRRWLRLGEKFAKDASPLAFDQVPLNALLLLVPEYSSGKERPFTINENGQREWW